MALSVERAQDVIRDFCRTYPVALANDFKVRYTKEELLHGTKSAGSTESLYSAGFIPGDGNLRRGRCDIASSAMADDQELGRNLRHELLGHFGINTFTPGEKRAILGAISAAREQPGLQSVWEKVDRNYQELSESGKAEEVFCFVCEEVTQHSPGNKQLGLQSLRETCISKTRPMSYADLYKITAMVAQGMHDRSRRQQNFPQHPHAQFRTYAPVSRYAPDRSGGRGV